MIKWNEHIIINAPINVVWTVLNDKKYMKEIMPKVVESKCIREDEATQTKVYLETYQEGKRQETYELIDTIIVDSEDVKKKFFTFVIAKMIKTEANFSLKTLEDGSIDFCYDGCNEGVSFLGKAMLKLMAKKQGNEEVTEFLKRVKKVAESLK